MVCVTEQITCEQLISTGATLVKHPEDELFIVHVAKKNAMFLNGKNDSEALNFLYNVAKARNGDMHILRSENIEEVLANFITDHEITHVIMGSPGKNAYNKYYNYLHQRYPDVNIQIIDTNERGSTYESSSYSYRQG